MPSFLAGFLAQLRRLASQRKLRLLVLLFAGACIASLAIYDQNVVENLPIAVLDLDNSRLSRTLRLALDSTPELQSVPEVPGSVEEARRLLDLGQVAAVVVLPDGLSADIKRGHKGKVLAATDMSNLLLGKTAYKALFRTFTTVSAGVELKFLRKLGEPRDRVLAMAMPLRSDDTPTFNLRFSYGVYIGPALLFFFLHLFVLILATSGYLESNPWRSIPERAGALVAVTLVGVAAGLLLFYGLLPSAEIRPHCSFLLVASLLAAFCVAEVLLVALFQAVIPSPLFAFEVTVLVGMLALMLAGVTYPADAFPMVLQKLAAAIPFTPFSRGFKLVLQEQVGFVDLRRWFEVLGIQGAIFLALALAARASRAGIAALARRRAC